MFLRNPSITRGRLCALVTAAVLFAFFCLFDGDLQSLISLVDSTVFRHLPIPHPLHPLTKASEGGERGHSAQQETRLFRLPPPLISLETRKHLPHLKGSTADQR